MISTFSFITSGFKMNSKYLNFKKGDLVLGLMMVLIISGLIAKGTHVLLS